MRAFLPAAFILAATGALAQAGPTITLDQPYTVTNGQEVQQVSGGAVLPLSGPPPEISNFQQESTSFIPNYSQHSGTYDWGAEAQGSSPVGGNSVVTSADAFTTINGDATNQFQVRFSSQVLLDAVAPLPYGYNGSAAGTADCYLYTFISGLTPGQAYTMHFDWDADYSAGLANSGPNSSALGLMQIYVGTINGFVTYDTVFDTGLSAGEPGQPAPDHNESGSGDIPFIASGAFMDFEIAFESNVNGGFANPFPDVGSDLEGATFSGEATFSVAPEPSALSLFVLGGLAFLRCRRPQRE